MFFDLKEVLNLNRLYAAHPKAVAMQVYAAPIVYNALRVAQSDRAAQVGWDPERLSPAKFYPKVATATYLYLNRQHGSARFGHVIVTCISASSAVGVGGSRRPGAGASGASRRSSTHSPVLSRAPALEVVRARPRRAAIHEVILAAMRLRAASS
jgi:hypothetical protein